MQGQTNKLYDNLSPELELVLWCSRLQRRENDAGSMNRVFAGDIDWEVFVHLTLYHRLYPVVYRSLSKLDCQAVPRDVLTALSRQSRMNISRTFRMAAELIRILQVLEQGNIRAVVMKGIPLAHKLYGDMALRPSNDLDILVWPGDIDSARKIIEGQGYQADDQLDRMTPVQLRKWSECNQHIAYWHPDRKVALELHWQLYCHGMNMPQLQTENSLTQVQIVGQSMQVLEREELLLYLILHGAVHAWFRLKWLLDIDLMIRQGEFDWAALYQISERLGVKAVVNQSIILSQQLFGTPVPVNIAETANCDRRAQALAAMALRSIAAADRNSKPKSLYATAIQLYYDKKYLLCLHAKWKERALLVSRWLLPSDEDLVEASLSDKLYFLYYFISPIIWCARRTRSVARRYSLW